MASVEGLKRAETGDVGPRFANARRLGQGVKCRTHVSRQDRLSSTR